MIKKIQKIFNFLSKRKCPSCGEHSISPLDFYESDKVDKIRCDKCDQYIVLNRTMFSKFFDLVLEFTMHILLMIGVVFALLFGNRPGRWPLVILGVSLFYILFFYVPTRFSPYKLSVYNDENFEKNN